MKKRRLKISVFVLCVVVICAVLTLISVALSSFFADTTGHRLHSPLFEINGYTFGISDNPTVATLKTYYNHTITVKSASGTVLSDTQKPGTGATVLNANGRVIDILVMEGDLDGNGKVTSTDFVRARAAFLGLSLGASCAPGTANFAAADVNANGRIESNDYIRMRKYWLTQNSIARKEGEGAVLQDGTPAVYDIILFWGQSNNIGYSNVSSSVTMPGGFNRNDINSIYSFSEKTDIDVDILQNTYSECLVKTPIPSGIAYFYRALSDEMEEITPNTTILGDGWGDAESVSVPYNTWHGMRYDPSTGELVKYVHGQGPYLSLETSGAVNMIPEFCRSYYEATGHGVIVVNAGVGGAAIQEFLPVSDADHLALDGRNYLYEAMKENFLRARDGADIWLTGKGAVLGDSYWVSFQGESNVFDDTSSQSDRTAKDAYEVYFNRVISNLRNELDMRGGAIVETAFDINNAYAANGVQQIHNSQENIIAANPDVILGSDFVYNHYVPDIDVYYGNSDIFYSELRCQYSSLNYYKDSTGADMEYFTALERALLVTCHNNGNLIHFHSATLSQVGRECAYALADFFHTAEAPKANGDTLVSVSTDNGAYFTNAELPCKDTDLGDPFLMQNEENGRTVYYLLTTNNNTYRSEDLKNWTKLGAYVDVPDGYQYVWAPEIYRIDGRVYLFVTFVYWGNGYPFGTTSAGTVYYGCMDDLSGLTRGEKFHLIGEVDSGIELLNLRSNVGTDNEFQNRNHIDGHLFCDTDGKYYFYYKAEEGQEIYGVQMKLQSDGTFARLTVPSKLFSRLSEENINEGPFMMKNGNTYYMMYSIGSYTSSTYRVRCATSRHPLAGFERLSSGSVTDVLWGETPINIPYLDTYAQYYDSDHFIYGAGHHGILYTSEGEMYIIYHSANFNTDKASISWNGEHGVYRNQMYCRKVNFDRVLFTEDGTFCVNGPTPTYQPLISGTAVNGKTYYTLAADAYTVTAGKKDTASLTDGICASTKNVVPGYTVTHSVTVTTEADGLCDLWLYGYGNATDPDGMTITVRLNDSYRATVVCQTEGGRFKLQLPDIGTDIHKVELYFDAVTVLSEIQAVIAK